MLAKLKTVVVKLVRFVFFCAFVVCVSAICGFVWPREKIVTQRIEVPVPTQIPTPDLRELIEEVPPAYGISSIVAAAIVERESGGKKDAIRFEPSQVERAKRVAPKGSTADDIRQYASSHCSFQVMGFHAPRFGISWADLYDPRTCAEVAMSILKDCMDRHKGKPKVKQLHGALQCYNGSPAYADAILRRLGELLIERSL